MALVHSEITFFRNGEQRLVTRLDETLHPDVGAVKYVQKNYKTARCKYKRGQYSSKLLVQYDPEERTLKQYFAQLTKHKKYKYYIVRSKCGSVGSKDSKLVNETFPRYSEARRRYKSVFSVVDRHRSIYDRILRRLHTTSYPAVCTVSPLAVEAPMDAEPPVQPHDDAYTNYALFEDDMKLFTQLFVQDFRQSETMRQMAGDLNRTAIGYPTVAGLEKAMSILADLYELYTRNDQPTPLTHNLSNFFHMIIPCSRDQRFIDSLPQIREKAELLKALASESYRAELTLPYPDRARLQLSRLRYPLVKLDRSSELCTGVEEAISSHMAAQSNPEHTVTLVNIYTFDTSDLLDDKEALLWYGPHLSDVYMLLSRRREDCTQPESDFTESIGQALVDSGLCEESPDAILFLTKVQQSHALIKVKIRYVVHVKVDYDDVEL